MSDAPNPLPIAEKDALRIAADILERAHRSGVEIDVPWWWLRDRADEIGGSDV